MIQRGRGSSSRTARIGSLASSVTQPLARLLGDRLRAPWLMPLGLALAAGGLAAAFGLAAAGAVALIPLVAALLLAARRARAGEERRPSGEQARAGWRDWWAFSFASAAATARTGFMIGPMAFVPSWFAAELGSSVELGSAAVAAMLMVLIWLTMDANFYPLVIVAQDALPDRVGLASGVVIGLSVGIGAGCTSVLGAAADAEGLVAALWGCIVLALLALACAVVRVRSRPGNLWLAVRRQPLGVRQSDRGFRS